MFALLPVELKEDIISYILETSAIRDGFDDFIAYTKEHHIPLYIVSGGIDFFVKPLLGNRVAEEMLYCNGSDFSGEHISITWPHTCDKQCTNDCGCCKPTIIRHLADERDHTVVIGDSITDLQAAKLADTVIARDFLIKKCEELSLPYRPFSTFYDVIHHLQELTEEVKA